MPLCSVYSLLMVNLASIRLHDAMLRAGELVFEIQEIIRTLVDVNGDVHDAVKDWSSLLHLLSNENHKATTLLGRGPARGIRYRLSLHPKDVRKLDSGSHRLLRCAPPARPGR